MSRPGPSPGAARTPGRQPEVPEAGAKRTGPRFPWLILLLLLGSVYAFWIYPASRPKPAMQLEFQGGATAAATADGPAGATGKTE